jgi:tRNA uridine 5-carboxymethylaminomethyl modification enzyme
MFTSRAEYRLLLRHDNADLRLTELGRRVGLVDDPRWARFEARSAAIAQLRERLQTTRVRGNSLFQWLRRPESTWEDLHRLEHSFHAGEFNQDVIAQVMIEAKYNGYIGRQMEQIERFRRLEEKPIPAELDYRAIPQLRAEAREKFERIRPRSLGQAGRISGISPADMATLLIHLKRGGSPVALGSSPQPDVTTPTLGELDGESGDHAFPT